MTIGNGILKCLLIQVYTKNNVGLIVVSGSMVNLSSLYTVIFVMNALKDLITIQ